MIEAEGIIRNTEDDIECKNNKERGNDIDQKNNMERMDKKKREEDIENHENNKVIK